MRVFGRGALLNRFKEEISSFTASFRGAWRTSLDSSTCSSCQMCQGGVTNKGWESSCPPTGEVCEQPGYVRGPGIATLP